MLPNSAALWPSSKLEAYKYTDLSKVSALDLPAGDALWQASWPEVLATGQRVVSVALPAARYNSAHKVKVPRGVEAVVLETLTSAGAGVGVAHQQLDITLEAGARLTHVRLQKINTSAFHWGQSRVRVARDAHYTQVALCTGAALARHELQVDLAESGAGFTLRALQLLGTGQQGDITTTVLHNAPHTSSDQLVKAVLAGDARGVYQGGIRVAPGAQKTNGQQQSRALLLGAQAEMNTKPELEIFADDVTCSHGAAVGALDETQLFYLQSRGLPQAQAKALLVEGFVTEVLEGHEALQQEAATWLNQLS